MRFQIRQSAITSALLTFASSSRGVSNGKRQFTRRRAPPTENGLVDVAIADEARDVEKYFHAAIDHIKRPVSVVDISDDLRQKRVQADTNAYSTSDRPREDLKEKHLENPNYQRSFFEDDSVDVRSSSIKEKNRRSSARRETMPDVLRLSGATKRHQGQIDEAAEYESQSPSDPTLVEEPEEAYGDTPQQLTDMLKERLIELKAEKMSSDRQQTFLRRRLPVLTEKESLKKPSVTAQLGDASPVSVDSFLRAVEDDFLIPGSSAGAFDPFASAKTTRQSNLRTHEPSMFGIHEEAHARPGSVLLLRTLQRVSVCSRREAIQLIAAGSVTVNGVVERNPFRSVVASDDIQIRGHTQRLRFSATRLWIYHKPANVVVSRFDPEGRSLFTKHAILLGIDHLIPIGSLPMRAHGVLMLTNDGELARVLEHPNALIQQTYNFRIKPAIDPTLAQRLNTEGVRINGILYKNAEFHVNHSARSRFHLKLKIRGECIPPQHLLSHLGRTVLRGGRESFGPFQLSGLPPGGIREVTVPPFYMQHAGAAWAPFVERDWPYFRRQRVLKLKTLARFKTLNAKELEELDTFAFDEVRDALQYHSSELSSEAQRFSDALLSQPHVDDSDTPLFSRAPSSTQHDGAPSAFDQDMVVEDITKV